MKKLLILTLALLFVGCEEPNPYICVMNYSYSGNNGLVQFRRCYENISENGCEMQNDVNYFSYIYDGTDYEGCEDWCSQNIQYLYSGDELSCDIE
tara:strand:+ start:158 stop:442 length:285 start_codon:yes stop_codon:yes gene_type:complete